MNNLYKNSLKRIFDLMAAIVIIVLLSPAYLIVAVCLYFYNDGKIVFTQERVGKGNKPFKLYKFKSMNDKKDKDGLLLKDTDRLTPFGKFIRKTSLDELPQIFNVFKGEMSLVGPRPLYTQYLPYYSDYHIRRHEVLPGITGLAQTQGRNDLKFSERFNFDVQYVDSVSFMLDMKILFKTVLKVFKPTDIKIGRPITEVDDIGITKGLSKNLLNLKEENKDS